MEKEWLCLFLAGENQFHNGEEHPEGDAALEERREIPHGLPGDIAAGLEGHFALQEEADDLGEDQRDERCQKVGNPAVGQVTAGDAVEGPCHQGVDRSAGKVENIVGVQPADGLPYDGGDRHPTAEHKTKRAEELVPQGTCSLLFTAG